MVDLTRRKTVIGLGLLATGSGATFTSAAFQDSISPDSDIRVVAADELILEPGKLFRNDDTIDGTVNPSAENESGITTRNNSSNPLFVEDNNSSSDLGSGLSGVGELPAASVNDATNGNINLQVALPLDDDGEVGDGDDGLLQVRNESNESRDIAIRFSSFGSDAGTVDKSVIDDIISFKSGSTKISPSGATSDPQQIAGTVSVGPGGSIQIYLDYNTTSDANGQDAKSQLETAAVGGGSPFSNPSTDTVDLIDEIQVGANPDSSNVDN